MLIAYLASDKTLEGTANMLERYSASDIYIYNKVVSAAGRMANQPSLNSHKSADQKLADWKNS